MQDAIEKTLYFIAQKGWTASREDFFVSLVRFLGETLNLEYALVSELQDDNLTVNTVGLFANGEVAPNIEYSLKGTPCENVMGNTLCAYTAGIQKLFPEDLMLVDMEAHSYIGIPLWGAKGEPVGLVAVLGKSELDRDRKEVEAVLQIVAVRCAHELESMKREKELEQSEDRLRDSFEQAIVGMTVVDLEGRFVQTSPAFQKMTGYSSSELAGLTFGDITAPEFRAQGAELFKKAVAGELESVVTEKQYVKKNGERLDALVSFRIARSNDGQPLHSLAQVVDISRRKKVEDLLRSKEELIRVGTELAAVAVWEYDLVENSMECSDNHNSLYGIADGIAHDPDAFFGRIHPDDSERVLGTIQSAVAPGGKSSYEIDYRVAWPDGSIHWLEARARIVERSDDGTGTYARGSLIDITQRKKMEEELAWELEVNQAIATLANALIDTDQEISEIARKVFISAKSLTDSEHGYVSEIDPVSADNVGHTLTEMLGDACKISGSDQRIAFPVGDGGEYPKLTGHSINTKEPFFTNQAPAHPNSAGLPKGHIPVDKFLSAPAVMGGEVVGQVALANPAANYEEKHLEAVNRLADLYALAIQRSREEANRSRLEDQIRQTQKLEAIGTLAGGIAHDFNNILGSILGYTELVQSRAPAGSEDQHDLAQVLQATRRAKELVSQILTFSRKAKESREPVQMHLVVGEAMRLLRQTIPASIKINQNISKESDTVLADPTQLHQIVMNLGTNAFHAVKDGGGEISILLTNVEVGADRVSKLQGLSVGRYVKLSVEDSGAGMSEETITKIFEPFYTTKGPGEGTGMGMAVVHGIVQSHSGAIEINSHLGKGTRIDVYLPYHSGEKVQQPAEFISTPKGTERILVVDDEPALAMLAAKMLIALGYRAEHTSSSAEALSMVKSDPQGYDLVLTDQTMPEMSGSKLTIELLKLRAELPVIICTGYSETLDEARAKDMGARALMFKPVDRALLARVVREVLDG